MVRRFSFILCALCAAFIVSCENSSITDDAASVGGGGGGGTNDGAPTPAPTPPPTTFGDISGTVIDASSGSSIAGATVTAGGTSVSTDGAGDYSITHIGTGATLVSATKTGYNTDTQTMTVVQNSNVPNVRLTLVADAFSSGKLAITVTWNASPHDLDAHMYVGDVAHTHVFYGAVGDNDGTLDSEPFAGLDHDEQGGYGPETMTVKLNGNNPQHTGAYRFFVVNYSNEVDMASSGALVKVYKNGTLIKTYDVSLASGTGNGTFWHVFDLTGTTFTDVNTIDVAQPPAPP